MDKLFLAAGNPLDHVYQWVYQKISIGTPDSVFTPHGEITIVSNHIVMQIIAVLVLVLLIPRFARAPSTGDEVADMTPRGFRGFIDMLCEYFRTTVVKPVLHEHTDRFIPYIWTVFFYILTVNLLGLLPLEPVTRGLVHKIYPEAHHGIGGAATGNIWVTASLAGCTMIMMVFNGFRYNGMNYIKHFFQGPPLIAPMIAVLEVIGVVAKCFALTVRLFANMVAGHVLLAVLLSFIGLTYTAFGTWPATGIGITVVITCVLFNLLELFVAFLQAFIFTFLTTLFIGQSVVIHLDDHGEGTHEVAGAH